MEIEKNPKTQHSRIFYLLMAIVLILTAIFIGQNWQPIKINLLGIEMTGRAFLVFAVIFASGLSIGYFARSIKKNVSKEKSL